MEVLPPTFAANSLACSIDEARTAPAMVRCATSMPWLALSVFEHSRLDAALLEHWHGSMSRFGHGVPFLWPAPDLPI